MYQLCCISCSPGPLGLTCTLVLEGQQWGEGYTGGVAGASPALQVGEAGGQQWIMVLVPGFSPWMDGQRLDAQPVPLCRLGKRCTASALTDSRGGGKEIINQVLSG